MRDAELPGDARRVVDVTPGAAGGFAPYCGAVVVKLQGDADDLDALLDQQCCSYGRIDPARHRHDDAMVGRIAGELEIRRDHGRASKPICQKSASSRAAAAKLAARAGNRPSPPRRANW